MFSFEHHSQVAHGYTELHDAAVMVTDVHGLMVLRQHTHRKGKKTHTPTHINTQDDTLYAITLVTRSPLQKDPPVPHTGE